MSNNVTRVMILTADAGFGHRSTALAVSEALKIRYGDQVDPVIVNPLNSPQTHLLFYAILKPIMICGSNRYLNCINFSMKPAK